MPRAEYSMVTKLAMPQSQRGQKILRRNFCVQCLRALSQPAAFTGGFVAAFHRKQYSEGKGNWHPKEGNPGTWEHEGTLHTKHLENAFVALHKHLNSLDLHTLTTGLATRKET